MARTTVSTRCYFYDYDGLGEHTFRKVTERLRSFCDQDIPDASKWTTKISTATG